MLLAETEWVSNIQELPAGFSTVAKMLGEFRLHYIKMATRTYESLSPQGITDRISIEYLKDKKNVRDAYDLVRAFFYSDPLLVELITTKRKDAPEAERADLAKFLV